MEVITPKLMPPKQGANKLILFAQILDPYKVFDCQNLRR